MAGSRTPNNGPDLFASSVLMTSVLDAVSGSWGGKMRANSSRPIISSTLESNRKKRDFSNLSREKLGITLL